MTYSISHDGWVTGKLRGPGGVLFPVERHDAPRSGGQPYLPLAKTPPDLVLHTTEGTDLDSAIATLQANFDASQWACGENRIAQLRPLWAQGAAVDTMNPYYMQVENVAISSESLSLFADATLHPLVALVAMLHTRGFITTGLSRPPGLRGLPVVLDNLPAAVNTYYRRFLAPEPSQDGVRGHVDSKDDEHWDPGSFNYPVFFQMVQAVIRNGVGSGADSGPDISMYRNPIRPKETFNSLRIDQGVDYSLPLDAASQPIYPIGRAKILTAVSVDSGTFTGWPSPTTKDYGGLVVYKLLEGPAKGAQVYVAENIKALVHEGDIVDTNIRIAELVSAPPNLETGWWSLSGGHTLARDFGGYNKGDRTACGQNMSDLIKKLGGPPGTIIDPQTLEIRPLTGTTPTWLPDWKNANSGHCSGGSSDTGDSLCGGRYSLGKILATIRRLESGAVNGYAGDYNAYNSGSGASGAYQFIDLTWNQYKGYAHARDAPKAVQDEYATMAVKHILNDNNCSLKWVPAVWYAGPDGAKSCSDWSACHPNPSGNSIQSYVDLWMGYYANAPAGGDSGQKGTGGGGCQDGGGGGNGGGGGQHNDNQTIEYASYDLNHIPRGLEHIRNDYYYMLFDSHEIALRVYLYDQDENLLALVDPKVISGQVDVDITQAIPKQLTLDFALGSIGGGFDRWIWGDPGSTAGIPNDKGLFHPAHFVRVDYGVLVQRPKDQEFPSGMPPSEKGTYHTWIWHTVFYGTPTNIVADEVAQVLHVEAQSKEFLLQHPNTLKWTPQTEAAYTRFSGGSNTQVGHMIQEVGLTYGEKKFRMVDAHEDIYIGLTETRSFIKENGVWPYIQKLADGAGYHVFYDNEGYLNLRKKQNWAHVATTRVVADLSNKPFESAPASTVATLPTPGWDESKWLNQVVVSAPKSKSAQKPVVRAIVYVQPDERGSYVDLARNGVDRGMTSYVEANGKLTNAQAVDLGNRTMAEEQAQFEQYHLDCLPFPHLDLYDPVAVFISDVDVQGDDNPHGTIVIPQKWTLPLVPSQLMSIGFNAPVQVISRLTTARVVQNYDANPEGVYRT